MFDTPGGLRVMHWHGEDRWVPMAPVDHDVASHDPERSWIKGARLFRCTTCAEQIAIAAEDPKNDGEADNPRPHGV